MRLILFFADVLLTNILCNKWINETFYIMAHLWSALLFYSFWLRRWFYEENSLYFSWEVLKVVFQNSSTYPQHTAILSTLLFFVSNRDVIILIFAEVHKKLLTLNKRCHWVLKVKISLPLLHFHIFFFVSAFCLSPLCAAELPLKSEKPFFHICAN